MKTFMQFIDGQVKGLNESSSQSVLTDLLAALNAASFVHHTNHWQSKGKNFYGNHLLLGRIYESIEDEYDTLGEKLVAYFDEEAVNQVKIINRTKFWVEQWNKGDVIEKSIKVEEDLQKLYQKVYDYLKSKKDLSLGLDDYLMASANAHETNLYLLKQASK